MKSWKEKEAFQQYDGKQIVTVFLSLVERKVNSLILVGPGFQLTRLLKLLAYRLSTPVISGFPKNPVSYECSNNIL